MECGGVRPLLLHREKKKGIAYTHTHTHMRAIYQNIACVLATKGIADNCSEEKKGKNELQNKKTNKRGSIAARVAF